MGEFQKVKEMVQKARNFKKEKKYEKARDLLEEGKETYPENNYLTASLADVYLRLNRIGRAEDLAENVLASDPENVHALTVMGNINYRNMNYEKAEEYFSQGYQIKQSPYLASRLIRTFIRREKYEQALDLCQEQLTENPDDSRFTKLKAKIYDMQDESELAEKMLEDYLQKEEDNFAFREKLKIRLKDRKPGEAEKELRKMLKLDKYAENIYIHTLLAEKLREQEKYKEAADVYTEALHLEPEDTFIRKNLGLSLYKAEKYEKALPYLKQSCREEPGDYYLRNTLQFVFKQLNQEQEGMKYFRELINETGMKNLWGAYNRLKKEVDGDE